MSNEPEVESTSTIHSETENGHETTRAETTEAAADQWELIDYIRLVNSKLNFRSLVEESLNIIQQN